MTHDTSVQSHRFHWNLSFGTPLFKGHLHSGDKNFGPWMLTFLSLHLLPLLKGHLPGGHSRDVWVEVSRQNLQNLRTLLKTNRPSIALFFFDNLQRYTEGNSSVKTLQLRKSPQCSGFFFLVATSVTTATPGRWFCTMTSVKTWYARSPILIERLARHADILWDIHVCSRVLYKSKMPGAD